MLGVYGKEQMDSGGRQQMMSEGSRTQYLLKLTLPIKVGTLHFIL